MENLSENISIFNLICSKEMINSNLIRYEERIIKPEDVNAAHNLKVPKLMIENFRVKDLVYQQAARDAIATSRGTNRPTALLAYLTTVRATQEYTQADQPNKERMEQEATETFSTNYAMETLRLTKAVPPYRLEATPFDYFYERPPYTDADESIVLLKVGQKTYASSSCLLEDYTMYAGPDMNRDRNLSFIEYLRSTAPEVPQGWDDVSALDYKMYYAMCKYVSFMNGYVGGFSNCEYNIVDVNISPLRLSAENANLLSKYYDCALASHVIKAINWFQTNHSVGSGAMTRFVKKALVTAGIFKENLTANFNASDPGYVGFYDAIHSADMRNILYSMFGGTADSTFSASFPIGFVPPFKLTLSPFAALRLSSFPAGTAKIGLISSGLSDIRDHRVVMFYPEIGHFSLFAGQSALIRSAPHRFHVGSKYLNVCHNGESVVSMGHIGVGSNAMELALKCIAAFFTVFNPNTTLFKSPVMLQYIQAANTVNFYSICEMVATAGILSAEAIRFVMSKYTTMGIISAFSKAYELNQRIENEQDLTAKNALKAKMKELESEVFSTVERIQNEIASSKDIVAPSDLASNLRNLYPALEPGQDEGQGGGN